MSMSSIGTFGDIPHVERPSFFDGQRLTAADLEGLGEAAWWNGRVDLCISARERAFALRLEAGEPRRAALVAMDLAKDHSGRKAAVVGAAWFDGRDPLETPVYRRNDLPPGARFAGPAIIEQLDATTVVPPGATAEVDRFLNIVMRVGG